MQPIYFVSVKYSSACLIYNIGIYQLINLKQTNIPDVFYAPQRVIHRELLPFLVRHFVQQFTMLL